MDNDSCYLKGLIVQKKNLGIDMDLGIDNTCGIDLNPWYQIGTPESHTYKRAECCLYAGFVYSYFPN